MGKYIISSFNSRSWAHSHNKIITMIITIIILNYQYCLLDLYTKITRDYAEIADEKSFQFLFHLSVWVQSFRSIRANGDFQATLYSPSLPFLRASLLSIHFSIFEITKQQKEKNLHASPHSAFSYFFLTYIEDILSASHTCIIHTDTFTHSST